MSDLRIYLAEAYAPSSAEFAVLVEQARLAAASSTAAVDVRHVRSILLRDDEICFHLFEAASMETLRAALDAAALRAHRIVEVSS